MTAERPNWRARMFCIPGEGARLSCDLRMVRSVSVPRTAKVPTALAATKIMASPTVNRLEVSPGIGGPPPLSAEIIGRAIEKLSTLDTGPPFTLRNRVKARLESLNYMVHPPSSLTPGRP
jgi:hypothetical protein